jgi:pantoate--beta-alanine ligase
MKIIRSIKKMAEFSKAVRHKNKTIGFVPTMGYLHDGHLFLVKQARKDTDVVVMSIFVNPTQFSPKEDFKKYPRNLRRDIKLAKTAGVDVIFYPQALAMYPKKYRTYINVETLGDVLCGKSRPGHFRGVATVVTKLFNIVQSDIAYFGGKDAQQALIIKRMTEDLNIPVKIKALPIVREKDGLAMSSRNTYLNAVERKDALVLYQALKLARNLIKNGIKNSSYIIRKMKDFIIKKKTAKIDYIEIVDLNNLRPVKKINPAPARMGGVKDKVLIVLAVWIGKTRLIDNFVVNP